MSNSHGIVAKDINIQGSINDIDAIFEYFSEVRFNMKFEFSVVLNIVFAIKVPPSIKLMRTSDCPQLNYLA
jgi:hypothetical protein